MGMNEERRVWNGDGGCSARGVGGVGVFALQIMAGVTGVTFKVATHDAAFVQAQAMNSKHELAYFKEYKQEGCQDVLQRTNWSESDFQPSENGFVLGVVRSYNMHHSLVIRPDDVWLAIVTQFGLYVNQNAEAMRSVLVNHKGKKQLTVKTVGTLRSVDYGWLAQAMSKELKKNVKDESLVDWILPKFSTTTTDDTIVGSVLLMATMKKYFDYRCCLACGIPQVTLAGSVEDWEDIHGRADKLKNYGEVCSGWASMLSKITAQFVETSKGNIDAGFWSKICHYKSGGSGPRYVSGWISAFCVFDQDGKWQGEERAVRGVPCLEYPVIKSNKIPAGYLTVDLEVDDNGVEHQTLMFAGHLGYEIVDDGKGIAPKLAWAIALKGQTQESQ